MLGLLTPASVALALLSSLTAGAVLPRENPQSRKGQPKALYFMTNDITTNNLVSLPIGPNGLVTGVPTLVPTGGVGSVTTNLSSQLPIDSDPLDVQGSVRTVDNYIFALNPGSNTLSMFEADQQDPTKVRLLGSPVDTKGEFPVSIAVSKQHNFVCVANSGAISGVACTLFGPQGLKPMDDIRDLYLNQTTPAVGPFDTVGSLTFNNDDSALFVTVKKNLTGPTSLLASWAASNQGVSYNQVRSFPDKSFRLFGAVPIPKTNNILSADAGFGAIIMSVNADLTATTTHTVNLTDNFSTCWSAYSSLTDTGFVTDNDVNHVVEIDLETGDVITNYYPPNDHVGNTEIFVVNQWIYSLYPGRANQSPAVVVFDISGGPGSIKQVQVFPLTGLPPTLEGMQVVV